jgi:hypothetical protein
VVDSVRYDDAIGVYTDNYIVPVTTNCSPQAGVNQTPVFPTPHKSGQIEHASIARPE